MVMNLRRPRYNRIIFIIFILFYKTSNIKVDGVGVTHHIVHGVEDLFRGVLLFP
jgi:hypothetical protein